ncbi:protein Wiz-like isoform X1 [Takifugu flavidus]|uniref:Protein Wiz n=1 Tax=Takifugu flavidus TaxID=433684 RepID=A0A5C6MTE3_9TELE|nr:protein Wiz-like isoform X1 [Takifugu flavidus]XP_056890415.1 protein Wiz-like isoform X1 [Takifugu flavidus]XP_056890416.1 protein Wiz-like isoform X1 [Takifugu flavidus]TWW58564.1 Protein Wiz [Takifugu flavidus]
MDSPSAAAAAQPVKCEVCGTYFESRRGLSSHARLHLRQLGVALSESSGAPISLLYQLVRERDGCLPELKADSSADGMALLRNTPQLESRNLSEPEDPSQLNPQSFAESPTRPKESMHSLLPSSPSCSTLFESRASEGSSASCAENQTRTKPLWAPLETDAPIRLDTTEKVHVCQLCGCWYETRKGLSSHARAHLRQIGIPEREIQGSPIDLLYRIMEEDDLKPISSDQAKVAALSSPSGSSSKRPSAASSVSKRPKTSADCTCILCGEEFESRKGLASHSRSHLNQLGVVDLLGKSSPILTIQELVNSGMLGGIHPPKLNSAADSSATSPASGTFSPAPGSSQTSFSPTTLSTSPGKSSPQSSINRAPKAKKGFRLAVDPLHKHKRPKLEPVEIDVSGQPSGSKTDSSSCLQKSPVASAGSKPLSADVQSPPTVLCDYCGQLFDTRKALSCHARAHLRHLGLAWSIRTSPIDLLKEVMTHGVESVKESAASGSSAKAALSPQASRKSLDSLNSGEPDTKSCTSPLNYSLKEKSPSVKSAAPHPDASCELCGFDFENRKALASHARAHLRQLGIIEWKADGATSPIELLSELIRKDPVKVEAITRRYRMGDLYIKKSHRSAASPSVTRDPDFESSSKPPVQHREDPGVTASSSRQLQGNARSSAAHSDPGVRSPRGIYPPKHVTPARERSQDTSRQAPRSGSIPALLPKPPLTPLVKLVGKVYSLKCRFCDEVFQGPLSVQAQWISHLQKHILSLGYKGKKSPPAAAVAAPALVPPVAV